MIGTLEDFRAYATARGNSAPAGADDADATAALVRASDYITYSYVRRFLAAFDASAPNVEPATYEAAILELATPNFFNKTFTPGERKVLTGAEGVRWQVIDDGTKGAAPVSTRIDDMLAPYISNIPGVVIV